MKNENLNSFIMLLLVLTIGIFLFQNYFQEIELKFDIENLNKYVREVFKIPKSEEYHKLPYYSFLF